ncbi:hypothetical protein M7I_3063 [Glarea lozoyensis 74030]|uniref:Uncharacterized protein n=1 Tax=Glarea lozoyensis (strain ATCC 74030 / MF5533) TaxID=1104152 RepID=H0EKG5_GLAL7|nr:hypothetical protein M7I_3063 [Glarea lozoyensis 74030]
MTILPIQHAPRQPLLIPRLPIRPHRLRMSRPITLQNIRGVDCFFFILFYIKHQHTPFATKPTRLLRHHITHFPAISQREIGVLRGGVLLTKRSIRIRIPQIIRLLNRRLVRDYRKWFLSGRGVGVVDCVAALRDIVCFGIFL